MNKFESEISHRIAGVLQDLAVLYKNRGQTVIKNSADYARVAEMTSKLAYVIANFADTETFTPIFRPGQWVMLVTSIAGDGAGQVTRYVGTQCEVDFLCGFTALKEEKDLIPWFPPKTLVITRPPASSITLYPQLGVISATGIVVWPDTGVARKESHTEWHCANDADLREWMMRHPRRAGSYIRKLAEESQSPARAPDYLLAALDAAEYAFHRLADRAGDVEEWNQGGYAYTVSGQIRDALKRAKKEATT